MPEETSEPPCGQGATPVHQEDRSKPKTCPKCEDLVKNGSSIHWTLAYSRCRCHRSWKYSLPEETLSFDTRCVSAIKRSFTTYKPHNLLLPRKQLKGPTLATPWAGTVATARNSMLVKRFSMPTRPHLPPLTNSFKLDLMKARDTISKTSSVMETISNAEPGGGGGGGTEGGGAKSPNTTHKQVSFCVADSPTHHVNTTPNKTVKKDRPSTNTVQSSIPSLPQIQSNCGLMTNNTAAISSTDSDSDEGLSGVKTPSVLVAKKPGKFEFTNLLKCVLNQQKLLGSDLFDSLDTNDDGHLSFAETITGLTKNWQNSSAVLKLEYHLKPLYHALGDDTYFGKRDFILCYAVTQLFKENNSSIPYLSNVDSSFYCNTVKPLLEMLADGRELNYEVHVSLPNIESTVKKLNGKVSFNIATALKLKKHIEGFTFLETLLFAPYLLTLHK